jgi:hypothetical protein
MIIFTFIFLMYKVDSTILWEKRFLDPIVIKAKELGLNQKADLDQIIVFSKIGIIPSQIDEIKKEKDENKEKEEYYEGDGKFDGEDELCFYARYCGEKINEDEIRKYDFEKIFEVELKDLKEKEKRFCYIGIKKKEEKEKNRNIIIEEDKEVKENKEQLNNLPKIIPEKLEFKNSENEFIVYQENRTAFFSNSSPTIRKIEMETDGVKKEVFRGIKAEIFIKLLNLINIRKNEKDISAKVKFVKGGDVRIIRVIQPYAEIGFGIKIPTSKVVSYIYNGFTYVENAVPIPFNLNALSKEAFANIFLVFKESKRFKSETLDIEIKEYEKVKENHHMWGYVEGDGWSAAYFIREITKIPIPRSLYFEKHGNDLGVGVHLDILKLPKGEHRFGLWGFFFPPGDLERAKNLIYNPLQIKIREIRI